MDCRTGDLQRPKSQLGNQSCIKLGSEPAKYWTYTVEVYYSLARGNKLQVLGEHSSLYTEIVRGPDPPPLVTYDIIRPLPIWY
jgi:hypothetical protein